MRVLFCVLPAYGHVYPLLPLALAFRDAGHEVEFATGDEFVPRLRQLGFTAHAVGMSLERGQELTLQADPALADVSPDEKWRFGAAFFGSVLARDKSLGVMSLIERTAPDLVVYEEYDLGSAIAASLRGVPAVGHGLGYQLPDRFRRPFVEQLHAVFRDEWPDDSWVDPFSDNPFVDISPPSLRDPALADPAQRITQRPVAWAEPARGVPDWVTRPRVRPLVYVTLGTVVYGAVESLPRGCDGTR